MKYKALEAYVIDIEKYQGDIPKTHNLVVWEKSKGLISALVLYGFDEINDWDFKEPQYGFMPNAFPCSGFKDE
jgi:hypothetical protein